MRQARTYQRRRYHDLQSALDRLSRLETERQEILASFPDLRLEARHLSNGEARQWQPRRLRRRS